MSSAGEKSDAPSTRDAAIDAAAFGVVYGSITTISLLMAMSPETHAASRAALALFAAVVAVALAKAFAELCEEALAHGRAATRADVARIWRRSRTVLIAANGPTTALAAAAAGLLDPATAFSIAHALAIALLVFYGARIGLRVGGSWTAAALAAAVTGGAGALVSLFKYLAH